MMMMAALFIQPSNAALVVLCLAVSFLYSGLEAGLLSVSRVRLRSRAQQGDRGAVRLQRLLKNPERRAGDRAVGDQFRGRGGAHPGGRGVLRASGVQWGTRGRGWCCCRCTWWACSCCPSRFSGGSRTGRWRRLAGLLEATSRLLTPLLWVGGWIARRSSLERADRVARVVRGAGGV